MNKEEQYAIKVNDAICQYFSEEGDGSKLQTSELT